MRGILKLCLGASLMLASALTHAHAAAPPAPKFAVAIIPDVEVVVFAGPGRPSFSAPRPSVSISRPSVSSSRPSFSTARPAYSGFSRSISTTPSRTFTYHAAPVVAAPRPATSTASRPASTATYHYYTPPAAAPAASSSSGGLSMTEAILLQQALASNHTAAPPASYAGASSYQPAVPYSAAVVAPVDEKVSPWAIASIVVLGVVVIAGGTYFVCQATKTA